MALITLIKTLWQGGTLPEDPQRDFILAACNGNLKAIQSLVADKKVGVNDAYTGYLTPYDRKKGRLLKKITALMAAAGNGRDEVVDFLLKNNANAAQQDEYGDIAQDFAIRSGRKGAFWLLEAVRPAPDFVSIGDVVPGTDLVYARNLGGSAATLVPLFPPNTDKMTRKQASAYAETLRSKFFCSDAMKHFYVPKKEMLRTIYTRRNAGKLRNVFNRFSGKYFWADEQDVALETIYDDWGYPEGKEVFVRDWCVSFQNGQDYWADGEARRPETCHVLPVAFVSQSFIDSRLNKGPKSK